MGQQRPVLRHGEDGPSGPGLRITFRRDFPCVNSAFSKMSVAKNLLANPDPCGMCSQKA